MKHNSTIFTKAKQKLSEAAVDRPGHSDAYGGMVPCLPSHPEDRLAPWNPLGACIFKCETKMFSVTVNSTKPSRNQRHATAVTSILCGWTPLKFDAGLQAPSAYRHSYLLHLPLFVLKSYALSANCRIYSWAVIFLTVRDQCQWKLNLYNMPVMVLGHTAFGTLPRHNLNSRILCLYHNLDVKDWCQENLSLHAISAQNCSWLQ